MQSVRSENSKDLWQRVSPAVNDAIAVLGENDRDAIVLRFLAGKGYREMAAALGGTEDAAQMRVSRALEKVRRILAKRGILTSAVGLGGLLAAHGTRAAPTGLAALVTAGIQGTASTSSALALARTTLDVMAWGKLKLATGVSLLALLAYQYHQKL
jgi:hypothetical protein